MSAPRAVSQSCQTLASLSFLVRETDARVMLSPPELLLLGCFRFSFSTRWLSRCLAAAPLASCLLLPLLVRPLNLGGARMEKASALSPSSVAGFCFAAEVFFTLFRMDECRAP